MTGEGYDECRLQVVVPRSWKWGSLPDFCHRLPAIHTHETPTFKSLVDRCWEIACCEVCPCLLAYLLRSLLGVVAQSGRQPHLLNTYSSYFFVCLLSSAV